MMEFIFAHFWTLAGAVGGLGTLVLIAAMVFFGVPLAAVAAALITTTGKLIEFLKTPVGQAVAIVVIIAVTAFAFDAHGHRAELKLTAEKLRARDVYWTARIEKASQDFAAAREDRDNSVAVDIDKLVNQRLLEIKAQEQALAAIGANHEAKPSSNPCVLTPDDLGVRGKPAKRTAGAAAGAGPARQ